MKALVVFYDPDETRLKWLLKPGFRHVFCVLDDGEQWVIFDARDGRPYVKVLQASTYDLTSFYKDQGYTVVETEMGDKPLTAPLAFANCVGLVKAMCAIKAPFVYSPYQLFRHLTKGRHP